MSTRAVALATAIAGLSLGFLLGNRPAAPPSARVAAVPGEKGGQDIWSAYEPVAWSIGVAPAQVYTIYVGAHQALWTGTTVRRGW